jgi:hypothetical protein
MMVVAVVVAAAAAAPLGPHIALLPNLKRHLEVHGMV